VESKNENQKEQTCLKREKQSHGSKAAVHPCYCHQVPGVPQKNELAAPAAFL